MRTQRPQLEREASELAGEAADSLAHRPGMRVWVVRGKQKEIVTTLLHSVGLRLSLEQQLPYDTLDVDGILVYGAAGANRPSLALHNHAT
jgi:hypothetical protein